MRDQEIKSEAFWQRVADDPGRCVIPGLLSSSPLLSYYRDAAEKQVVLERLGGAFRSDMTVLEVGCGGGRWTTWLAQRCRKVVAVDISERMVTKARERAEKLGIKNVEWGVGSFEQHEYTDTFDMVYLSCCLQYMDMQSIIEAMERLSSAVTDESVLLSRDTVSLTGRSWHRGERYKNADPVIYRIVKEYQEVMAKTGWELQESWQTYVRPAVWRFHRLLPRVILERLLERALPSAAEKVVAAERKPAHGSKTHRHFVYTRVKS